MPKNTSDKLTERITVRLPHNEKLKLDALARTLHTNSASVIRVLMNSTNTLDELIVSTGAYNDKILKTLIDL